MNAFIARLARFEHLDETDVDLVGLCENSDGTGRALIFERARTFTDQDKELGMDSFAVMNEFSATVYGAVTSYQLSQAQLDLDLTAEGAETLGLGPRSRIPLDLPGSDFDQLAAGLRAVLEPDLHG